MTEYMHLVGTETVQRAAHTMSSAATDMQRAASEISSAVFEQKRNNDMFLNELRAILEEAKKEIGDGG